MIECCQDACLSLEPGQPLFVSGELFGQHFDGDLTPELGILRPVHFSHAARTNEAEDFVAC